MPVTIHDVARRLSLSVTTVSRALAGYSDVAESTRQRVIETARQMGYTPTHAARQLRRKRAETIGVVFPTLGARFADPFFSEFLAGVGDEVSRRNYDLLFSVAPAGEAEQETYRRLVNSQRVDGLLLVRTRVDDWRIHFLHEQEVPFVCFGRSQTVPDAPHIGVDGRKGVRQLVQHLVERGHSRIAFIAASPDLMLSGDRLAGYRDGLKAAKLSYDSQLVVQGDLTREAGYAAAQTLLERSPTAIIGANDLAALGAMRRIQEHGLRVGIDVAVAGFDGIEAGEHAVPPLTTVAQPVYEIGGRVCSMLVRLVEGEQLEHTQELVEPTLIIRASTGDYDN